MNVACARWAASTCWFCFCIMEGAYATDARSTPRTQHRRLGLTRCLSKSEWCEFQRPFPSHTRREWKLRRVRRRNQRAHQGMSGGNQHPWCHALLALRLQSSSGYRTRCNNNFKCTCHVSQTHTVPLTQLFPTLNTQPHTSCPGVPQTGYDYTGAWYRSTLIQ